MNSRTSKRQPRPLDQEALEQLALFYVGRYATTRAKLRTYLQRKLRERGWEGASAPDVAGLAERLADLRYVDDSAFAEARASSLRRKGMGERRVGEALRAAGIEADEIEAVRNRERDFALEAAMTFARRRRYGPFAQSPLNPDQKKKAFAAMLRAGHPVDVVKKILNSCDEDFPELDDR